MSESRAKRAPSRYQSELAKFYSEHKSRFMEQDSKRPLMLAVQEFKSVYTPAPKCSKANVLNVENRRYNCAHIEGCKLTSEDVCRTSKNKPRKTPVPPSGSGMGCGCGQGRGYFERPKMRKDVVMAPAGGSDVVRQAIMALRRSRKSA